MQPVTHKTSWRSELFSFFDPPSNRRSAPVRYGLAALLVGVAFILRYSLRHPLEEHAPFTLFIPAIMVAAWCGGVGPAIVAMFLSTALASYFFVFPFQNFSVDLTLLLSAITYLFSGFVVVALVNTSRKHAVLLRQEVELRRRLEHQVRESEERFRKVFEHAAVGIVQLDTRGHFLDANPKFCEISGYRLQELEGRAIFDLVFEQDRELDMALFAKMVAGELVVLDREKRYVRKDGKIIWGSVTAVFLRDAQGHPQSSISVVQEITHRIEAEAALHEAQHQLAVHADKLEHRVAQRTAALQSSLKDMETFCYSIAHDLRAPLRAMRGFTTALVDDYAPALGDEGQLFCCRISEAAARMDEMIAGLLAYGLISHAPFVIQSVDVTAMVSNVLSAADQEIRSSGAEVLFQRPLPRLCGNPVLLEQVLRNLIGNALKFVPPGITPRIHIYAERLGPVFRLYVEDNGIGIAPEHQARIFEPFHRLHSNAAFPGTGIGLALVKKAVDKLGGRVGVESPFGQGSRFWIELRGRETCPCEDRQACALNGP